MLTESKIKNAKPREKPYKLADGHGMYLEVTPAGGKYWRYKFRINRKEQRLTIGRYPETSISQARMKLLEARSKLAGGEDPRNNSRTTGTSTNLTLEKVAREWLENRREIWSDIHLSNVQGRLERDIFPYLGQRQITTIRPSDLLAVLRKIEKRGNYETAHRLRSNCSEIFRFAIASDRAERDIAADLKGALKQVRKRHLPAIIEPNRLGKVLNLIDTYSGTPIVKTALKLAPLVFVRPGELRHARWEEIDFTKNEWRFTVTKIGRPHVVPLSLQAAKLLKEIYPLTGSHEYVFPNARNPNAPMSNNAILSALRRLGVSKDEMCGHGFRATARTILDEELKVRPDFIEHQLSHVVKGPLGRAYNRTEFLEERHDMMQLWADFLDDIKGENNEI
jgi:integrase